MLNTVSSASVSPQKRAYALDALRGFAILMMVLSGIIPYQVLPAWMYHAQEPPPTHTFNPHLAGLTWVDLVFPLFLFSMGAAIPLALSRRLTKGLSIKIIILSILKRGFLLATFAIFLQHIRPFTLNPKPTTQTWWVALLGFIILFFMFVRLPDSLNLWKRRVITLSAWLSGIILLTFLRYPDGSGFSLNRSDIILLLLANVAVFGSIIWLFTRSNLLLRLGILGLLMALRLSATTDDGWVDWLWSASPVPWIFKFEYLSYLFLIIPGTIAGDFILSWIQNNDIDREKLNINVLSNWKTSQFYIIVLLMFSICLILLVGLQSRLILATTLTCAVLCLSGWWLFKNPTTEIEYLIKNLYQWGVYWLAIGLFFEPYEGGIKKDSPTMSYYFITAGIALFLLIALTIIIDVFEKQKWIQLLINNGQNPMIGYVGVANLIWPILGVTGFYKLILENTQKTEMGILRAVIYTLLLAYIVHLFTRRKLFLRT